jgi:alpha-methylacyl-CoA racemase
MGPLDGIKVIELAGIGPGPFGAMVLADLGADVVRVDRAPGAPPGGAGGIQKGPSMDLLQRGKRSIGVDLKNPSGVETVLKLVESADALVEGFRPGVAERLGVGPDVCLARNARLVYGRMTGWGQDGPYAHTAGHDINYISLGGVLAHIGRNGQAPVPPMNLVGDFGGGGLLLAFGVVCALVERQRSGEGQVIDVAMVDGSALLMTIIYGLKAMGMWQRQRGVNLLDTGAPFYDVYECADGNYISIGSLESQFYAELLQRTGLEHDAHQMDMSQWPAMREKLTAIFKAKTRDEWCAELEGSDVCFAPVLDMWEAHEHPHNVHRGTFPEIEGVVQPAPAPRFVRTPGGVRRPPCVPGQHTDEILRDWGFDEGDIAKLRETGAVV